MSRQFTLSQDIIEIIANHVGPKCHYITSNQKQRSDDIVKVTSIICRNCLSVGIACSMKQNNRLQYLRCHLGLFLYKNNSIKIDTNDIKKINNYNLPEN